MCRDGEPDSPSSEMIKTITLCGYKSFHASSPVRVELRYQQSDPIYFYGLNGAGKSAIAEAIRRHPLPDERLPHCDVEVTAGGPFRFLVYNESFVTRVLGESAGMPGIFTLIRLHKRRSTIERRNGSRWTLSESTWPASLKAPSKSFVPRMNCH